MVRGIADNLAKAVIFLVVLAFILGAVLVGGAWALITFLI